MKKIITLIFCFFVFTFLRDAFADPPQPPVLLLPVNASPCQYIYPIYDWNESQGATGYRLQVSSNPGFTALVYDISGIPVSQYMSGIALQYNNQYYWRVNATGTGGTSDWSNTFLFSTSPPLPYSPILIYPQNGSTNVPLNLMLSWYHGSGATSFRVQVSQSTSFTTRVIDSVLSGMQLVVNPGVLNQMTVYYWRVLGQNCGGSGPWSVTWSFVTGSVTSVQQYSEKIPAEYKLHNNYPNPFNPVTKIKFDLPENSEVTITIFDAAGRSTEKLLNGNLNAGMYEIIWNAGKYSSGVYFCRFTAGNFTAIKKLVLTK
ncbi:MAG: T9SS type A sorting domain-containing protein [Ignavibacteriae bacterium]|nr:T9SS type A sorting domain-containing protein [Ignavibacteriota bacterium]